MKKQNKILLSIGTVASIVAPLATVVACQDNKDELDFNIVTQDEFALTNDKVKNEVTPILEEYKKFLNSEMSVYFPVAEDDFKAVQDKLSKFTSSDSSTTPEMVARMNELNAKISNFEAGIANLDFNLTNRTYQKLKEYQYQTPTVISRTVAGIWSFVYNNLVGKQLYNQLVYTTDNVIANKQDMLDTSKTHDNEFWIDTQAAADLFKDDLKADQNFKVIAIDKPGGWDQIVSGLLKMAAGPKDAKVKPTTEEQIKTIENWLQKNLIVWDGKDSVPGSLYTTVVRGNVASPIDIAKAKALVQQGQKNAKYSTVKGDYYNPSTGDTNVLFTPDYFFFKPINNFDQTVMAEYKTYFDKKYPGEEIRELNPTTNQPDDRYVNTVVKDSEDWYKLVDILAKDKNHGKNNIEQLVTSVKTWHSLSDLGKLVFQKLISYIPPTTRVYFSKDEQDLSTYTQIISFGDQYIDKSVVASGDLVNSVMINVETDLFDSLKPASGTWEKTNTQVQISGDSDATKLVKELTLIVQKFGTSGLFYILDKVLFPAYEVAWGGTASSGKPVFRALATTLQNGWTLLKDGSWVQQPTKDQQSQIAFGEDETSAAKINEWRNSVVL